MMSSMSPSPQPCLRLNPYVPEDEDDDDVLPAELGDLLRAFLEALPPAAEQAHGRSGKTAAGKAKKTITGRPPSRPAPSTKGRRP